jgi:hypothetical protein
MQDAAREGQGQQFQNPNIAPPTEVSHSTQTANQAMATKEPYTITGPAQPLSYTERPTSVPQPDMAGLNQPPIKTPEASLSIQQDIVQARDQQEFTTQTLETPTPPTFPEQTVESLVAPQTQELPSAGQSINEAQVAAALDVPNFPLEDNRGKTMDTQFSIKSQQPTEVNSVPKEIPETPTKSKYDAIKPTLLTHIKKMTMQDALNFINESVIHGGPNNSRIDDAELEQTYLEVLNDYLEEKKQGLQQAA